MQIITLTTDMGLTDHYVASVKGTIYSLLPHAHIVDISHEVQAFDVAQAAFFINNCFRDFPRGTIHVCGIDSEPSINFGAPHLSAYPSILLYEGHYFVSNDNGFFGLLLKEDRPEKFWRIEDVLSSPKNFKNATKNMLIPAAHKIAIGVEINEFATEYTDYRKAVSINAVLEENLIKGTVIHIDHYGNVITNVSKELFNRFGDNTPFTIFFRRKDYFIDEISNSYNEVAPGEKVAIFNDSGLLEIAINRGAKSRNGGASTLFGLHVSDTIRIEFAPRGSKQTLESLF